MIEWIPLICCVLFWLAGMGIWVAVLSWTGAHPAAWVWNVWCCGSAVVGIVVGSLIEMGLT